MEKAQAKVNLAEDWYDTTSYPSAAVYTAVLDIRCGLRDVINLVELSRKNQIENIDDHQQNLLDNFFLKFEHGYKVLKEAGMLDKSNKKFKRVKINAEQDIFFNIDWTTKLRNSGLISNEEIQAKASALFQMMQEPEKYPNPSNKLTIGQRINAYLFERAMKHG